MADAESPHLPEHWRRVSYRLRYERHPESTTTRRDPEGWVATYWSSGCLVLWVGHYPTERDALAALKESFPRRHSTSRTREGNTRSDVGLEHRG